MSTPFNPYAFPSHGSMGEVVQEGMSLRDYFAAHAPEPPSSFPRLTVQTVSQNAGQRYVYSDDEELTSWLIRWRWHYADLMLKARQQ